MTLSQLRPATHTEERRTCRGALSEITAGWKWLWSHVFRSWMLKMCVSLSTSCCWFWEATIYPHSQTITAPDWRIANQLIMYQKHCHYCYCVIVTLSCSVHGTSIASVRPVVLRQVSYFSPFRGFYVHPHPVWGSEGTSSSCRSPLRQIVNSFFAGSLQIKFS